MRLLTHNEAQKSRAQRAPLPLITGFDWPGASVITPRGRDHSSTVRGPANQPGHPRAG